MTSIINTLSTRESGTRFRVAEDGTLTRLSGFKRFRYSIDRGYRNTVQTALKEAVSRALGAEGYTADEVSSEAMRRLPLTIFARSDIPEAILTGIIPGGQSVDRGELTEDNITQDQNLYARVVVTAQRALALGIKPIAADSGANGAQFLTDLKGRAIAVAKLKDNPRKSSASAQSLRTIGSLIFGSRTVGTFSSERESFGEMAAPRIATAVGLQNVPLTDEASLTIDGATKDYSVQLCIPGSPVSLTKHMGVLKKFANILFLIHILSVWTLHIPLPAFKSCTLPAQELEDLILIDFLLGNIDRHFENILITESGRVFAIDNGRSLPSQYSSSFFSLNHQYKWRHFLQSDARFSDASKGRIINIDIPSLENIVTEHYGADHPELPGILTRLRERIAVLQRFANEDIPLYKLSLIRQEHEFKAALPATLAPA